MSGPGRRSPKTWTFPSASRTRRVPCRMKRRSRLDSKRTWQSSMGAASLRSNMSERGHGRRGGAKRFGTISRKRTLHHQGTFRVLIESFGSSSKLEFSNSVAIASLKHFNTISEHRTCGYPRACLFGANNGTRKRDAPMPLLQKSSYPFPFAILLSMAICRKKSLFA